MFLKKSNFPPISTNSICSRFEKSWANLEFSIILIHPKLVSSFATKIRFCKSELTSSKKFLDFLTLLASWFQTKSLIRDFFLETRCCIRSKEVANRSGSRNTRKRFFSKPIVFSSTDFFHEDHSKKKFTCR